MSGWKNSPPLLACALACATVLAAAESPPAAALAARIARVENGLLPAARLAGTPSEPWSIASRLAAHKVPGVSIAVINDGRIEWARGYGLARAGEPAAVTPDTLFQAASISKPVAAAAALTLVESGALTLDADVNEKLTTWKIPAAKAPAPPVTLRRLLSHTAGLNVDGFRGYAVGEPRPTLVQILAGAPPANSEPIRIILPPGTQWRYSGGGYCVAQQLLLDVTGQEFPALLRQRVLLPAGMAASTFEQPLPAALAPRATAGHRADGSRLAGDAYIYPELAAAGLWTTPSDLARFALALADSLAGRPSFLTRATAEAMITPPLAGSDYGLGLGIKGVGENLSLGHNGGNEGFRCALFTYPRTGRGAIVMTNSDNGSALAYEIIRALAREYGWPDHQIVEKTAVTLAPAAFDAFAGRYEREETVLVLSRTGPRFFLRATGQPRREIYPSSDHEFFFLDGPDTLSVERGAGGTVTHVVRRTSPPQIFQRVR